jgi:putative hydrolase of the HAD superfamily
VSAASAAGGPLPTVVFDFAGVLFHWQPVQLLQQVIPQHATDDSSARHWAAQIFQGYDGDWAAFDRGTVSPPDLVQRIASRTGLAPAKVQAVVDAVPLALQPLPGTVALLQQLHAAGHPLFFLSNMPAPYADHLERTHGFLRLFADGVYSGRVQQIKPERAIYDLAAQRFGVPPGGLLFFDDVVANVAAAQAAGWQAAHFTDADAAAAVLQAAGFDLGR